MSPTSPHKPSDLEGLSSDIFERFVCVVRDECGIVLDRSKLPLLAARLHHRVTQLGLGSFSEYARLFGGPEPPAGELHVLIEAVTTHETSFFREPHHFEIVESYLREQRPDYVRAWSSACSNGAEPFSLAMVLEDLVRQGQISGYEVLATDISDHVLRSAQEALYPLAAVRTISPERCQRYLLRSRQRDLVRISDRLRRRVGFRRLNLVRALPAGLGVHQIIFCRNVLIYFSPDERAAVVGRLVDRLPQGGLLALGHAEGDAVRGSEVRAVAPTIYRRTESRPVAERGGR